jgi:hypothetical protein
MFYSVLTEARGIWCKVSGFDRKFQNIEQARGFDPPLLSELSFGGRGIYDIRYTIYDLRFTIYDLGFAICDL